MNLTNKKNLAAKVLNVGRNRVVFSDANLQEIKEAITRQDIIDLFKAGAIKIRPVSGRLKVVKRKRRRRVGKVKKKVNVEKKEYIIMTRKLRTYSKFLLKTGEIDKDKHDKIRRMIRAKKFKSKRHLNETYKELE